MLALMIVLLSSDAWSQGSGPCKLERLSVSVTGGPTNGDSSYPSISSDGRFVAFASAASNLVAGDTNLLPDSFVVDRRLGTLERVTVSTQGLQGDGRSVGAVLSGDGRMVAFGSEATNFDPRDTDPVLDVYVHDRTTKTTTLVSERLGPGPSVWGCFGISISADGRYVAFDCADTNVLPGITQANVYVHDLTTGVTELVSVGPNGQHGSVASLRPSISGDGRFVAFYSGSTNWFPVSPDYGAGVFVRDRATSTTLAPTMTPAGYLANGNCADPAISSDGRFVAFETTSTDLLPPGQPFCCEDVVRWDRLSGELTNVSKSLSGGATTGQSSNPALSADGRLVVYEAGGPYVTMQGAGALPQAVLVDTATSVAKGIAWSARRDSANAITLNPAISGDGLVTAFDTRATNLLPGNSGFVYHVYVAVCDAITPMLYCKGKLGPTGCTAWIDSQGTPSASSTTGFRLRADGLEAGQVGTLFYGTTAPWGQWYGGSSANILCVRPPLTRALVGPTAGTSGCDGALSMDFNAWIASGVDPSLVAGQPVYAQAWFRNSTGKGQLSDALAFVIEP